MKSVVERKHEFQEAAFKFYNITLQVGETRSIDLILKEAYLDFYSLSL